MTSSAAQDSAEMGQDLGLWRWRTGYTKNRPLRIHYLRTRPLLERKRQLKTVVSGKPGLLYVSHFERCGTALFKQVCRMDLEGIVAKSKQAPYRLEKSWVKIKNRAYSQAIDRGELFKKRVSPKSGR